MAPTLTLLDLNLSNQLLFNVSAFNDQDLSFGKELAINVTDFAEKANLLLLENRIGSARDGGDSFVVSQLPSKDNSSG